MMSVGSEKKIYTLRFRELKHGRKKGNLADNAVLNYIFFPILYIFV